MTDVTAESKLRRIGREIQEIERARGIDQEANRAREGPLFPLYAFSRTPFGTPEGKRERIEERVHEEASIRRRIRAVYFSVPDAEARRLLISKTRQLDAILKEEARAEERQAEAAVVAAMSSKEGHGFLFAVEIAALAVGTYTGGWVVGVITALLAWQLCKPISKKARDAKVVQAERDADIVREGAAETLARVPIFSELEEHTGSDDEIRRRHA